MLSKQLLILVLCFALTQGSNDEQGCPPKRNSGCPGVTFHFPNGNQITDYVQYRSNVPSMKEATICAWVEAKSLYTTFETFFSYASKLDDNELYVEFRDSKQLAFNANASSISFDFAPKSPNLNQFHFCVSLSVQQQRIAMFHNGLKTCTKTTTNMRPVLGGGSLILGQDQDAIGVKYLDPKQVFRGNITNFMLWPRVLTDQEVFSIAANCVCPPNYSVSMTIDSTEVHGSASYTVPEECPTLRHIYNID